MRQPTNQNRTVSMPGFRFHKYPRVKCALPITAKLPVDGSNTFSYAR